MTSGNNGYPAGTGWDEATGWGSPNLANLAADWSGASSAPTATATAPAGPTATRPAPTSTSLAQPTNTPTRPAPTNTPAPTSTPAPAGGASSGTHSGSIASSGASDSYTFTPGASGASTIGTCATSTANDYDLYVYNSAGTQLASSTTSSYCEWVGVNVVAGQTYTVKTLSYAGTGTYRSAWNVNGAQVVWSVSGSIGASGGNQTFSFPALSSGAISLSSCGPAGTDFDLYLLDAGNAQLAASTTSSNCEALTYTPSARGLFRLEEVAYSGTGAWSGTIKTY